MIASLADLESTDNAIRIISDVDIILVFSLRVEITGTEVQKVNIITIKL